MSDGLTESTYSIVDNYLATEIKEFYPIVLSNHTELMLLDLPAQVRTLSLKEQNKLSSQNTPIELNTAFQLVTLISEIVNFLHMRKWKNRDKYWILKLYNYLHLFETFLKNYRQQEISDRLVWKTIDAFKILSIEIELSKNLQTYSYCRPAVMS
ncbi:MAG: hypothetical protein QNJ54_19375 [Prochloraceae cyanobacterium]|nr:hypothetical protein [Prochloraceae cyanobacterium]